MCTCSKLTALQKNYPFLSLAKKKKTTYGNIDFETSFCENTNATKSTIFIKKYNNLLSSLFTQHKRFRKKYFFNMITILFKISTERKIHYNDLKPSSTFFTSSLLVWAAVLSLSNSFCDIFAE